MSAFSRFRAAMLVVVVVVVPGVEEDDEEVEDLLVVSVGAAATALPDSESEDGALTAFVEGPVEMVGSVPAAVGPLEME